MQRLVSPDNLFEAESKGLKAVYSRESERTGHLHHRQ